MKLNVLVTRICRNGHTVTKENGILKASSRNGRVYLDCKECAQEREVRRSKDPVKLARRQENGRRFHARHKNRRYAQNYIRQFGITPAEKQQIFVMQGRACGNPGCKAVKSRLWHTDHDHITGVVRGVLCDNCNLALGHVHDNPKKSAGLAKYLRERGY